MRAIIVFGLLGVSLSGTAAFGQTAGNKGKKAGVDMRVSITPLWENAVPDARGKDAADIPGVWIYQAKKPNGTAVVVCPGGGYGNLALDHEGIQIADWLNSHGITAFVLKYRLGPKYNHPTPLHDAQRAMRYVRSVALNLKIDEKRVGILGFSAGGHLASTVGTHQEKWVLLGAPSDAVDRHSARPDFMILMYPVITLTGPAAHAGSRNNLLGKNPDAKLVESLCNDKMVSKDTPPTFLVHTTEDKGVPPENSVLFYQALTKNKVPAEMHIYEKGVHGLGLALKEGQRDLPYASWPDRCVAWLKGRGFLQDAK